jgi:hypothetical protein
MLSLLITPDSLHAEKALPRTIIVVTYRFSSDLYFVVDSSTFQEYVVRQFGERRSETRTGFRIRGGFFSPTTSGN